MKTDLRRRRQLGLIHILKKDLTLSDDNYRAVLLAVSGKDSSKDLNQAERCKVIDHLKKLLPEGSKAFVQRKDRPENMSDDGRGRLLGKIEALLADAGRPWIYADAVARRMFGVDRVAWCLPDQLSKIVAALVLDAKRHGRQYA